ncbi:Pentatricopeptide repeat-containing protein [Apostasia shenzhenica]|uniref:Pentatricopeptide repeat-containing protein n=1 Tax=Apostasia shenzhenica TaxID=1088818 RepID=A0A2I0BCB5_9ASPA|nr:Pentatricopeptide repeat-containing protein [Apostasia shenzhenica]
MKATVFLLKDPKFLYKSTHLSTAAEAAAGGATGKPSVHRGRIRKPSVFIPNLRITRLSRRGRISDARRLFDETPDRDLTSWTALIAAYARAGRLHEAQVLFDRSDALRDVATWTSLLSGYGVAGRLADAEELFNQMPEKNVVSWNTLVSAYAENGEVGKALKMFEEMPERNIVSWNTIITALARSGRIDDAQRLFFQMPEKDLVSWTAIISGLSQNERVDEARKLFDRMPSRNVVSWNAMISGYTQNQRIGDAFDLFEVMPERNISSWNTMINGFMLHGDMKSARRLFNEMPEKNVVSWTTIITGYTQCGENELALKIFLEMFNVGFKPNEATFVSVLSAVGRQATHLVGLQVHQIINKTNFQFSPIVNSVLITMYSKCGEIAMARKVFDLFNHKDLVNWNGMIAAYAHHGFGREAIWLFEEMQSKGLKPSDVTYVALLSACSHSGLVEEGMKLFGSLVSNGFIEVRDDHYACFVDLFSRAGRFEEAGRLLSGIDIKSSSTFLLGALLGGCNSHSNCKLGELAAEELLEEDPNNAGVYLLMSKIYASVGKWKEAEEIQSKMADRGLKKQPGCSWIEIGNRVHVFINRDKLQGHHESVYDLLQELHQKMKMIGCSSFRNPLEANE